MKDKELYQQLLGLSKPWGVERVELKAGEQSVEVVVGLVKGVRWVCPECRKRAIVHDYVERRWRHLDTCQFKTFVLARVPRVRCEEHGVTTVRVPWAEERSRLTALFERLAIDVLSVCSISEAKQLLRMTWSQVDAIKKRAVERGLSRKRARPIRYAGIDEKSIRRGHRYVTVVTDLSDVEQAHVDFVGEGRSVESLEGFWSSRQDSEWKQLEAITMDLWQAYVTSTLTHLPEAESKVVHDRFHLTTHMTKAVDTQRAREHRELSALGDTRLIGTKHAWLYNWENIPEKYTQAFEQLRTSNLKTAKVWSFKELLREFWAQPTPESARAFFAKWYSLAMRSRLAVVKKVAKLFKAHLPFILNWFRHRLSTAANEAINAQIAQLIKRSCGFRNTKRFIEAIYFHFGGLDLYPSKALRITH